MEQEITHLEEKLARLIEEHQRAQAESRDLRGQLAKLEIDNKRLNDKLAEAARRVETALAKLPAESA